MIWRRLAIAFGLLGLMGTPLAQEPAADALGRLFYTPAERAALEARRNTGSPAETGNPGEASAPVAPQVRTLRLDGLVHRDAQPALAFLNRRPVEDGGEFLDYRVIAAARSVTLVTADGRRYRLQVGQTLLREEQRILDALPPGALDRP